MPELPEVQTVLNGLAEALNGIELISLKCLYPNTVRYVGLEHDEVLPDKVIGLERRGKYLILHLKRSHSLIIHLRMTGKLIIDPCSATENKHQRACFSLSDGAFLRFIDIRTFGKIVVCKSEELPLSLPKLGPEPLGKDFDVPYLQKALMRKGLPVKNALLDQKLVAGLGNIYACEILYRAKIAPQKAANTLSKKNLEQIVLHTREVLQEAIANNGTSISDFRRVDDKTGQFQNFLRVYQKAECPLGHGIKRIKQGGRSTFYCPVCQK
ncbi:MAG: bifunctional DNA-formamidopyrimidine glycosylase/DNA-(apurinic or apyrimidinic site) lyase [Candidatus Cloacimonetes bacterium]|nr:bifunctional DNA-formamidopyrimidine glycosylase/DNA-(apurinic or apyrimidinic site) lyase [Candidatus Cloacimonadota bacterium]